MDPIDRAIYEERKAQRESSLQSILSGESRPLTERFLTRTGSHLETRPATDHVEQLFLRSDGRIISLCWVVVPDDPEDMPDDLNDLPLDEPDDIVLLGPDFSEY
jgi:hypothetical protein